MRSLRVRLTLYLTGMLALTAGLLLLFVNAAAHLARPPITDLPVLVNGEVYNAQVVNAAQVQEQEEALSRLRIFSWSASSASSSAAPRSARSSPAGRSIR